MPLKNPFARSRPQPSAEEGKVVWSKVALELLSRQDRFTSGQIIDEFAARRNSDATVDLDATRLATRVAEGRYAVMWHRENDIVYVDGVVASPTMSGDAAELKSSLDQRLEFEVRNIRA